jgi:hypothetical protein
MPATPTITTVWPDLSATPRAVLPSAAAGPYVGVAPKTLSNWRAIGEGPRYIRLGKSHARIVYRISDLDEFLADRVIGGAR